MATDKKIKYKEKVPQLVTPSKDGSRPGYRGDRGYQGSSGGSKASSGGSKGTSNTGGAGNQKTGNTKDDYRANYSSRSIVKGGGTKKAGGGYKDAKVSGNRGRSSAREFVQQVNSNNAVRAAQTGQKFTPYRGGSRPQGGSLGGLGSLIMSGLGMAMGIPGLGLLTGGLGKLGKGLGSLNDKIQSTDFARSTSLMDYLDAKKYGGIDARGRKASKNMREAKGIQTAMDMRPTTLDPREMARMGLQMPTAPMSKPTFSDPYSGGPQAINNSQEIPFESMVNMNAKNQQFFDSINKGVIPGSRTPMVPDANVLQGSVLDAQSKKGIMQTIGDAIISPLGAEEIDFSQLQQANNKFTPEFNFVERNAPGVKNYTGTTKQDYINAVTSGQFGKTAGSTSFDRNVGNLFEGVDLNKNYSPFSVEPTFISNQDGTGTGYIDVDQNALQNSALNSLPEGFFVNKADGGRIGYNQGGLASMFTRRR